MTHLTDAAAAAMADQLAQHPDYRVLRRVPETLNFGGAVGANAWRVAVLDTETTGLDPQQAEVIQLALAVLSINPTTGQPVGEVAFYSGLQQPQHPIPPEVTALTGITNDMVQGQQLNHAGVAQMMQGVDWVVAHNAAFDRPFVDGMGEWFAQAAWVCSWQDVDWGAAAGSLKLEALAAAAGVFYDAHRADTDVHALIHVLSQPLADGQTGWQQLAQAAHAITYKLYATGSSFESKDLLKARGYRWDGDRRVWWRRVANDDALDAELLWLRAQVYGSRRAQLQLEQLPAQQRYSRREGEWRTLPLPL